MKIKKFKWFCMDGDRIKLELSMSEMTDRPRHNLALVFPGQRNSNGEELKSSKAAPIHCGIGFQFFS